MVIRRKDCKPFGANGYREEVKERAKERRELNLCFGNEMGMKRIKINI